MRWTRRSRSRFGSASISLMILCSHLPWGSEPNVSISLSSNILRVYSRRDGAGDLFPAAALPEFAAAQIIIGHHDNDALNPGPAQTHQAFIQQTLTESASLVSRINRQMIDMSAAPIMTA